MRTRLVATPAALLLALGALVSCTDGADDDAAPGAGSASTSATTSQGPTTPRPSLTPVPLPPPPPPTGKLRADIEQSSRDGAANQFQVWVDNDTAATIHPIRVTYTDDRFRTPLPGTRLRAIPSQSRRGFPVAQPDRPACDRTATSGTVTVDYRVHGREESQTVRVSDEAEVIDRIASARCLELAIDQVARLRFADEVTASGDGGQGSVGTMTLVVRPTGRPGPTLVIDTIAGNPVLSPGDKGFYDAHLTITSDQRPRRIPIPLRPTRCDAHAFGESGSFAAFAFNVHVDGKAGQFVLRLGPTAAVNAIDYAKASCGFLTSIGGGQG